MKTKADVIKAIDDPRITELVRGEGYHYFIFDDGKDYATHSVYTMCFSHMPFDRWVEEGQDFLAEMS